MSHPLRYETLYKIDTKGKTRVWYMEQQGSMHRTVAGILDGKLVTSGWAQCEATNVGRSNERDPVAQATFEIRALYEYNLTREYHRTVTEAQGGAHFFKPMLAQKYKKFVRGYAQPKLDGIRCIAKKDGLWSREGKLLPGAPHVFEKLKPLFVVNPNLILDGELYNHDLKDDFDSLVSEVKKHKSDIMQYHVYDYPSHGGKFGERSGALLSLLIELGPVIHIVETVRINTEEEYDELHAKWLEDGYEGSMWRDDTYYEQTRSKALQKRKVFQDCEFKISRVIEGKGNWAGCAKSVEFIMPGDRRLENGERPRAGIKGKQEALARLLKEADQYELVTVKFFILTPAGIPRFGVATKWHGKKREM